jgi:hypothetical protein
MSQPLRSPPITGASSLLRAGPPARPHRYSTPHSFRCSAHSLSHPPRCRSKHSIGPRFPTFHVLAADQTRAAFTPDTTWPINGHPPGSSRGYAPIPVLMPSDYFSTLHQRFALARLSDPRLTTLTPPFPRSLPTTVFSQMQYRGGLTPPPAGRRRRATKPSSTTQHCLKKVYLHPPLSAFVAHMQKQVRQHR